MRSLLVSGLVITLCLVTACGDKGGNGDGGGGGGASGPVGEWEPDVDAIAKNFPEIAKKIAESMGQTVDPNSEMFKKMLPRMKEGMMTSIKDSKPRVVFNSDGTCFHEETKGDKVEKKTGKWKLDGDNVVITADNAADQAEVPSMTYKDGKLMMKSPKGPPIEVPLRRK